MPERILITGANRGIGLAVVEQYLLHTDAQVFAGVRNPDAASALQALVAEYDDRLVLVQLEVTDGASRQNAFSSIHAQTSGLDALINNAGIDPDGQKLETITAETMRQVLEVNTIAPLLLVQTMLPLLKGGKNARIVNISSSMGSLERRTYGGSYAYCASKSALNMHTRGLAADLRADGITCVMLDPGWVRTDMGGQNAALDTVTSATGIVQVVSNLTMKDSGTYLVYDGTSHPF
jgi:NAD(P)-dependent dehydrogenase (short-subunit alcohol dehydrogenase family)